MEQHPSQTKILMLSASPSNLARLRLEKEQRELEAGLVRSRFRDSFQLIPKVAVRPQDMQRALLDHTPQIVHFSGHGEGDAGLALFKEIGFRQGEAEALLRWAELHDRTGQPDVAHEACKQALALAIELGIPLVEECRALKAKLEENV